MRGHSRPCGSAVPSTSHSQLQYVLGIEGKMPPAEEQYHVKANEQEILKWREAKRLQLRELYQRHAYHPTKQLLHDESILRYNEMKMTQSKRPATNAQTFRGAATVFIVFTALYSYISYFRNKQERTYRLGQVSDRDRMFKFR